MSPWHITSLPTNSNRYAAAKVELFGGGTNKSPNSKGKKPYISWFPPTHPFCHSTSFVLTFSRLGKDRMHSLRSTLVLILTTFLTHSCSARSNATEPSIEAITSPGLISSNSTISLRGDEVAKGADNFTASRRNAVNRFDPDTNPDGLVNLGTAENVCFSSDLHLHFWPSTEAAY